MIGPDRIRASSVLILLLCGMSSVAATEPAVHRQPVELVQLTADEIEARITLAITDRQRRPLDAYLVVRRGEHRYLPREDGSPVRHYLGRLSGGAEGATAWYRDLRSVVRKQDLTAAAVHLAPLKTTPLWLCLELWDSAGSRFIGTAWPSCAALTLTTDRASRIVRIEPGEVQDAAMAQTPVPSAQDASAIPPFRHPRVYRRSARETAFIAEATRLLANGTPLDHQDPRGMSLLHRAAAQNFKIAVELLIQGGAKLNLRDRNGFTPVAVAAASGHTQVVELLLQQGADPNLAAEVSDGNEEKTPLAMAVEAGDETMAELLRSYGASAVAVASEKERTDHALKEEREQSFKKRVKAAVAAQHFDIPVDDKGSRLLHMAAEHGYHAELMELLRAGANPDPVDNLGRTPLFRAIAAKDQGAIGALLQANARIDLKDRTGRTAYDLARETDAKIAEILFWAVTAAQSRKDMEAWEAMATQAVTQNVSGAFGSGALMPDFGAFGPESDAQALARVNRELAANRPVDARDPLERTPLLLAVQEGHVQTAAFLLARGADVNARFMMGTTPLHLAARQGDDAMVDLLLRHGANPAARNHLGATAEDLARQLGHAATADRLRLWRR